VLDYAFPILLQLMRIPLLTARLIGDGMELLFEGIVRCLPVSRGALIVNPNVKLEVAEAIRDALQMSHDERVTRWQGMIGPLQDHDVSWWAAAFLTELATQKARVVTKGTCISA
jgi:trehalose-6-phosphate synthase